MAIYLDNAATTRVDDRVIQTMDECFRNIYGNASSLHYFGSKAREVLDKSRETLADLISVTPGELFFTSGGTESNNWALRGVAYANRAKGNEIVISAIEHDCILKTCEALAQDGFVIKTIPVDESGIVIIPELERLISQNTVIVSVMHANNEIGTIQPIEEIAKICRDRKVILHTDACQTFGKIPVTAESLNVDLLTINAHKIYGPKGAGALFVRKGTAILPLLHGGGQENNFRSSTENIPGIAGFAKAAQICSEMMLVEGDRLNNLRNDLIRNLENNHPGFYLNGHAKHHLPGFLNFSFAGLEGESIRLLLLLDDQGIAVSTGSACSSNHANHQASHVLKAIGRNAMEARGGIRISLGRYNTAEEIKVFIERLHDCLSQLIAIYH